MILEAVEKESLLFTVSSRKFSAKFLRLTLNTNKKKVRQKVLQLTLSAKSIHTVAAEVRTALAAKGGGLVVPHDHLKQMQN